MSGVNPKRREALLQSAKGWREYASTCHQCIGARAAIGAAVSLEKEAEDGIARCACCQKPFSQHAGILKTP